MVVFRRRHVTLLEIILVMAILMLVGGLVAVGINKALVDQRFRTEVSLIVDDLRLAQDLMLILGTDVHLKFAKESDEAGIKYWLELETDLNKEIKNQILRKRSNLKTIHGVFFKDETATETTRGQLDIRFLSKGNVMSRGLMRLATSDAETNPPPGTMQTYICLPGYPKPIFNTDILDKAEAECKAAAEMIADTKLTLDTFSKLPESLKLPEEAAKEEEPKEKVEPEKGPSTKKKASQSGAQAGKPAAR